MPGPSATLYLYGDLFVEKAGLLGIEVPCRNVKVSEKSLAIAMVAAAVMSLKEAGNIQLQAAEKKSLGLFKTGIVNVTFVESPSGAAGMELAFMANLSRDKPSELRDVVYRMLGRDTPDPWRSTIDFARTELLEQGYFMAEQRNGIGKVLGQKIIPQGDKIAALEGDAQQLKPRFEAFQKADAQFYKLLRARVSDAIYSRTMQSENVGVPA